MAVHADTVFGFYSQQVEVYRYVGVMDLTEELLAFLDGLFPTPEPSGRWLGWVRWPHRHSWVALSALTADGGRIYKAACSRCGEKRYGEGLG